MASFALAGLSWSVAGAAWNRGDHALAVSAFLAGVSLGPCLAGYLGAPRAHKPLQRRLVLLSGGASVLAPALLQAAARPGLEGWLLLVLVGATGAAAGHTLATRAIWRARARSARCAPAPSRGSPCSSRS